MRRLLSILLLMFLILPVSAHAQVIDDLSSTPREREFALVIIEALRTGNFGHLDTAADPEVRKTLTPELFDTMSAMVPPGPAVFGGAERLEVQLGSRDLPARRLIYLVGDGLKRAQVMIVMHEYRPGWHRMVGLHVQELYFKPGPPAAAPVAVGRIHYLWLTAMALAVMLSLAGLVAVIRTRGLRLKWLWAIGCLFSFVSFQLNWVTGEWGVWPFSFTLLGAGFFRFGPAAPWVVQFAIPVVAITFLILKTLGRFDPEPEDAAEAFL